MVSVYDKYKGKKLGKALCINAINYLLENNCFEIFLTTDDFRIPAIATYFSLGFLPVIEEDDMKDRFSQIIGEIGYDRVLAYENLDSTIATVNIFSKK